MCAAKHKQVVTFRRAKQARNKHICSSQDSLPTLYSHHHLPGVGPDSAHLSSSGYHDDVLQDRVGEDSRRAKHPVPVALQGLVARRATHMHLQTVSMCTPFWPAYSEYTTPRFGKMQPCTQLRHTQCLPTECCHSFVHTHMTAYLLHHLFQLFDGIFFRVLQCVHSDGGGSRREGQLLQQHPEAVRAVLLGGKRKDRSGRAAANGPL